VDLNPGPGEVKEYLSAVIPHEAADRRKGPDKADLYWFRPNPRKGSPGVTVKRVVDLGTGMQVGDPVVLINYLTPLAPEELSDALRIAREKSAAARALYAGREAQDVEVASLVHRITATGQPDGTPGDRVVNLQLRAKRTGQRASVMVNLTKETVRDVS